MCQNDDGTTKPETLELSLGIDEGAADEKAGDSAQHVLELKLVQSRLESLRQLGAQWCQLRVLWVCRCGISDLIGVSTLPRLQELYAAFNEVIEF